MARTIAERRAAYAAAVDNLERHAERIKHTPDAGLDAEYTNAVEEADLLKHQLEGAEADVRARAQHKGEPLTRSIALAEGGFARIGVNEPDRYGPQARNFMLDLYQAQIKGDLVAQARLQEHHEYEMQKRDTTSSSYGGLIPPQYLIDMYGKALRNGRVFADQVKHEDLPDTGMVLIVPRLTRGTEAAIQASENDLVANQDLTETDLSIPVRTVAGYVGVSRQSLERAQWNEGIIFEDLVARNFAALDYQCINGSGNSGEHLGINKTVGIQTVALGTWSIQNLWGTLADACQRIASATGGLGLVADKCVMHPRRWAAIASSLDASDRPLMLPAPAGQGQGFNIIAGGDTGSYGPVGQMFGLEVYTDPNIPTDANAMGGSNEDLIFVFASPAVHLWERTDDPVTLAFEQTAGQYLNVKCIVYSYSAFTAGIHPEACAVITGAGLEPPSYGVEAT